MAGPPRPAPPEPNFRRRWLVAGCVLVLLIGVPVGCALRSGSPTTGAGSNATQPAAPGPQADSAAPPAPRTGLAMAAVRAAEGAAGSNIKLGVAVYDRTTKESAVGQFGAVPFYTASLAKLVVAVDMFDRRRLDGLTIGSSDLDLLRRALSLSDDSAMNALWVKFDGEGAAARVSRRLTLSATTAPDNPAEWGEMAVPAVDFIRVWNHVLDEMPAADRDFMVSAMDSAPATARDGFNQAFGLLDPSVRGPNDTVAKQGWMCCISGKRYLHSAGRVGADGRFVVVLLTTEPRATSYDTTRQGLDTIASAAVRALA